MRVCVHMRSKIMLTREKRRVQPRGGGVQARTT